MSRITQGPELRQELERTLDSYEVPQKTGKKSSELVDKIFEEIREFIDR